MYHFLTRELVLRVFFKVVVRKLYHGERLMGHRLGISPSALPAPPSVHLHLVPLLGNVRNLPVLYMNTDLVLWFCSPSSIIILLNLYVVIQCIWPENKNYTFPVSMHVWWKMKEKYFVHFVFSSPTILCVLSSLWKAASPPHISHMGAV